MAEIEHFVDPEIKDHERFDTVKDIVLRLLPKDVQAAGKSDISEITIGQAVAQVRRCPRSSFQSDLTFHNYFLQGMVDNQTLGYFIARIYLFLIKIGINPARLRFRQHMANEMAHYAADCWDAEIDTSYGWIECVGCADRSAYDLTVHSIRTDTKMVVRQQLSEPRITEKWVPTIERKLFGPKFKKDARIVEDAILALNEAQLAAASADLEQKKYVSCCYDFDEILTALLDRRQ